MAISSHFESLADTQVAEAFSEVFLRQPDLKVETTDDLDDASMFPAVPAYLEAISAAYWEDSEDGPRIRRQVVLMSDDPTQRSEAAQNHLGSYRRHVGSFHEIAGHFEASGIFLVGNVALRAAQLAQAARLRTVAAFTTFRTVEGNNVISGLMIPRLTSVNLPLENRDQFRAFLDGITEELEDPYRHAPGAKKIFQSILQNDPSQARFAFMAATLSLPDVPTLERSLGQIVGSPPADSQVVLSRQERRDAAKAERRARRRSRPDQI